MENLNQKELIKKLMNVANLIEKNRAPKASYITIPEENLKHMASLWGVSEDEAIIIIQKYLKYNEHIKNN